MNALLYDIEIVKGIVGRNESPIPGIEYCGGWNDHAGMGISVIGCLNLYDGRPRLFCKDNWSEFAELCKKRETLISFNGIGFDNHVLRANGIEIDDAKCYDLLREIWIAAGLGPTFQYPSHAGYGLDAVCEKNFGQKKTGNGALAPVQWQQGKIGAVMDYCMADCWLEERLFPSVAGGTDHVPKNRQRPETEEGMKLGRPKKNIVAPIAHKSRQFALSELADLQRAASNVSR